VKSVEQQRVGAGPDAPATGDHSTRAAVARLLLEQGPVSAAAVAAELALTGPAVRRHLDALIADGEAEIRSAPRRGTPTRGRPARQYLLTDAGRVRFGHGYDELAVSALRFLGKHAGPEAVRGFARSRVVELLGPEAPRIAAAGSPRARTEALARVLQARGYAAQVHDAQIDYAQIDDGQTRAAATGVQLCQHHCPVAHVAAEFPELCEAETQAFAEVLGTHVQRLATIARGDAACTTHVPLEAPERPGSDRSAARGSAAHSVPGGPPAFGSDAPTTTTPPIAAGRHGGSSHDDRS
jgi:predicted ArsR family transcriptional regulator